MLNNLVSPTDLYSAARETCIRLYVANGGSRFDRWNVQPFPGTAAISKVPDYNSPGRHIWTLCMPALPLDIRVPRWQADLIAGYTVHELLHALWSDWNVIAQAANEGLKNLHNAIEDNRIEAKASKGELIQVSEARRLLEALNVHVYNQAAGNPRFNIADPTQFAFVLNLAIFREKLGYISDFPADWRKRLPRNSVKLIDFALSKFDGLTSCADALALARELRQLAIQLEAQKPAPKAGEKAEGSEAEAGEKAEAGEDVEDSEAGEKAGAGEDSEDAGEDVEDVEDSEDAGEDSEDAGKAGAEAGEDVEDSEAGQGRQEGQEGPSVEDSEDSEAGAGEAGQRGQGRQQDTSEAPGGAGSDGAALDVSDHEQAYAEVNLNDLGRKDARTIAEAGAANAVINAPNAVIREANNRGNARNAGEVIQSPAKLRRHVTAAVKSPERVGTDRFQISGRLDLRNIAGIGAGAANVYRRRVEDEGREAAVSLLIDCSDSMRGGRIEAARALALHMGDALKAAGVRFEVATFKSGGSGTAVMTFPKPFALGWNDETKSATAGMNVSGGTAMLPAIRACCERLAKVTAVSRRILMVLTDGADSWPPKANAEMCKLWRGRNVEVIGIGLMLDAYAEAPACVEAFQGNAILVNDCAALSAAGLAELAKQLDKAAPRSA